MRNDQLSRALTLLDLLDKNPHGLSIKELHEMAKERGHEANDRTIRRDLEAFQAAGFPVNTGSREGERSTYYSMDRTTRISEYLTLSIKELVALYISRSFLKPLSETSLYNDLENAFDKFEEKLGFKQREFIDSLSNEFFTDPMPKWGLGSDPDVIETLRASISEEQTVRITYQKNKGETPEEKHLGGHCLYFAKGSLYLLAEDLSSQKVKTYAVARIKSAEDTKEVYKTDKVNPEDHFKDSFGVYHGDSPVAVELKFSKMMGSYIKERRWHSSQRLVNHSDGTVTMHLEVSLTPDFVMWVLGFAGEVEVMGPSDLIEQLKDKARGLLSIYEPDAA